MRHYDTVIEISNASDVFEVTVYARFLQRKIVKHEGARYLLPIPHSLTKDLGDAYDISPQFALKLLGMTLAQIDNDPKSDFKIRAMSVKYLLQQPVPIRVKLDIGFSQESASIAIGYAGTTGA